MGSGGTYEFTSLNEYALEWNLPFRNWDAVVPAIVGIVICCRRVGRGDFTRLPLMWLAGAAIVFVLPGVWQGYYLPFSIPLCLSAGIGIAWLYERSQVQPVRSLVLSSMIYRFCALSWAGLRVYSEIASARHAPQIYNSEALKEIERVKPFCKFMFADEPIYSFHSGIPLSPELSPFLLAHRTAVEKADERVAARIEAVKPSILLLASKSDSSPSPAFLDREYQRIYKDPAFSVYALKRVIADVDAANP